MTAKRRLGSDLDRLQPGTLSGHGRYVRERVTARLGTAESRDQQEQNEQHEGHQGPQPARLPVGGVRFQQSMQPDTSRHVHQHQAGHRDQLQGHPVTAVSDQHQNDSEHDREPGAGRGDVAPQAPSRVPSRGLGVGGFSRPCIQSRKPLAHSEERAEPEHDAGEVHGLQREVQHRSVTCLTVALVLGMPSSVHAHGFERTQQDPFVPWAAGLMGLSLLLYLLAWAHARRRRGAAGPLRRPQLISYLLGNVVLAATLFGALDVAAEHSFAAHLSQHMLLLAVVPPLLLLGRPMLALALLLPRILDTPMGWAGRMRRSLHLHAVLATLASTVAMWLWHAPVAMHEALSDDAVHWLMHLSFLAAGLWFWMVPLEALRGRLRAPWPALAGLLALMMQMGLIGALLTLSPRLLVPLQAERALAAGLDPITDQQLAGLLMWVPFCLPYLVAAVILGLRTAQLQRRRRPCRRAVHDSADIDS